MQIFELKTKNGRAFRVGIENKSQMERLNRIIRENKKKSYELFTDIKCVNSGIHDIKTFEALAGSLV